MTSQSPYPAYPAAFDDYDPRSPARRASILMYFLGLLGFFGGICIAAIGLLLRDLVTQPQFASVVQHVSGTMGQLQARILAVAGVCFIGGFFLIVLARLVRRGTRGPIVAAIGLNIFALLVTGAIFIAGVLSAESADATLASILWMLSIPVLLLIVLLIWLTAALRNVPYIRSVEFKNE